MTESWDLDPDLVFPDGPLSLLNSDTEADAETSGSSVSALFSTRRQSCSSNDDDDDDSWAKDPDADDCKGGTLRLGGAVLAELKRQNERHLLSSSGEGEASAEDSFSSNSSSERQSTIKASLSNPASSHTPLSRIDPIVLSVLAAGAKGTVTRLEPTKKPSPIQAGIDWDQDLVMPDAGLVPRNRGPALAALKPKASFASGISDELEGGFDHADDASNCLSISLSLCALLSTQHSSPSKQPCRHPLPKHRPEPK